MKKKLEQNQQSKSDKSNKKAVAKQKRAEIRAENKKSKQVTAQKKREAKLERERIKADERAKKAQKAAQRQKERMAVYAKIRSKLKNRKAGFDYNGFGLIPRVELAVKGDKMSVVSRLSSVGIVVTDIKYSAGETLFKIRKKDLRKAVAILSEMCYTHKINATYGITSKLAFWAARIGLIAGAALSVIGLNISYGYIWRVQITGNSALSAAAIESELKRSGVSVGRKKTDELPTYAAEVLGGMEGVSDASCEIVGTTLYVHVLESTDSASVTRYGEYVSEYDATVTRIVMRNGSALVKRGDVVKRGDIIANGEVYSTAGELLYTGECEGEIYGNVAITYTAQIPISAVEYRRTGKTSAKTVYTLFGKQLGKVKAPYKTYEFCSHTSHYDVLIPLYATTYSYCETAAVEYERDINEAAESFAKAKIEEMMFEGEFDYTYGVEQTVPGLYTVHLFITGETVISRGR